MSLDLSVIITTFNSAGVLPDLLSSLRDLPEEDSPSEVIVVDNASMDDSIQVARSFPGIRIISSPVNSGLAAANNIGANASAGSSLLFLNPDTVVLPGALTVLMEFEHSHGSAGLLGPSMTGADDELQSTARTYPSLADIALRRTPLGRTGWGARRLRGHLFPVDGSAPAMVDWLVGAAIWLTAAGRERFGLMSDRYFLYFEDVDWCWRAAESGMEVWYVPGSRMRHVCSRDSAGAPGRALWHHLGSMVRFFSMHPSAILSSPDRTERT